MPVSALELAERALEASSVDALASVVRERSLTLRFGRSRPTQATSVDDVTVELAAICDGHVGRAATNRVDDESLRRCARRAALAAEAAAQAAGPGGFPGFPAPAVAHGHQGHDVETATLEASEGARALATAFAAGSRAGVLAGGIWTAAETERAIASSTGVHVSERLTDAFMKVVAIAPGGASGYASATGVAAGTIDADRLAERAAAKARAGAPRKTLPPGEYAVVMEGDAVAELLWVLGLTAFNGLSFAEGRGALSGRLGTRVASAAINLSDSPRFPRTLPRGFDAEGVPKAPLPLIQDGVAHAVVHDTRSGAVVGSASTGHALAAGGTARGPRPTNLVLSGGGAADESELCAGVERGIYVTRLWYTNVLRPEEALFTAVTRDGTFLIDDGSVGPAVADMRITDSALGILARAAAIGVRSVLTSDGEFYGRRFATGSVCPPLRADGVRFTGTAGA